MRIVVTGGSGFLGSRTVSLLATAGHQVVCVDAAPPRENSGALEWHVADLRRREGPYVFLRGADVVVHLANHSNASKADAQTVLTENTAMNVNVFQAAAELRVRRIVFASSVQAMSGGPLMPEEDYPKPPARRLPAIPITGDAPALAGNAYGQSKIFGEMMLARQSELRGQETVAIRFPYLAGYPKRLRRWFVPENPFSAAEFYGWLWVEDAARLLLACVTTPSLPSFRIYHPAGPLPLDWPDAETIAATYLADAPRKNPGERLTCLIDTSSITRDLGWTPSGWDQIS